MAKIRLTGGQSWVQVLPWDEGYDDAIEATPMTIEGRDGEGRMFGGRSEAGVEDVNEDEAQVSTGVTQFGLTPEGVQRGHADFVGYTGSTESLGDPTGTPSTGEISTPGTGTTPGTGATPPTGTQDGLGTGRTAFPEGRQNAFDIVTQVVTAYGLDISLADEIWAGMKEARSPEGLAFEIRQTDAYAARFPGMQMRKDLKLPAITEAQYLQLERDYREVFRAAALPDHFSDGPEDFAKLIAGDVSPAEVQTRVSLAEQALDTANQDTVLQLVDFYGLTRGDLVSYYLDPEAAVEVFGERISLQEETRRMGTARLSAAAGRTLGTGLSKATAEQAQRQGVAAADLSSALAQRAGLTADLIGSEGVTADVLVAGDVLGQAQERARIRRTAGGRAAPFARGGGALTTGAGVTGFGAAE